MLKLFKAKSYLPFREDRKFVPVLLCKSIHYLSAVCVLHFLSKFETKLSQHFAYEQDGKLVERRLHQRKWKWVVYGSPKDQRLTSITPVLLQDDTNGRLFSLFFTTSTGSVFEYQIPRQSGELRNYGKNQLFQSYKPYNLNRVFPNSNLSLL